MKTETAKNQLLEIAERISDMREIMGFSESEMAEKTEGVECAAYDITQEKFAIGEAYNNNDMAITASSERPERAAMVLDLIKNDTYLNHLFRLGIEGVHYTDRKSVV